MNLNQQVNDFGAADEDFQPPDTQIAAGPLYVVEAVNDSLSVYYKNGMPAIETDLNVFFAVPQNQTFTDPRVLYDVYFGRWLLSGWSLDANNNSQTYLAVSATSDPTGVWNVYLVQSNTASMLTDQPMIGFCGDKVVMAWNQFTGTGTKPAYNGAETTVLQYSSLLAGSSTVNTESFLNANEFRLVPAQSWNNPSDATPPSTCWMTVNKADSTLPGGSTTSPTLGVIAVAGTPDAGNVTLTETDLPVAATNPPPDPSQPGGTTNDTQIDDRQLSAVFSLYTLWTTATDACTPPGDPAPRDCLRVDEVNILSTPSIELDQDLSQPGVDEYYPAVTMEYDGYPASIAYTASSPTMFPSAEAVAWTVVPGTGVGAFSAPITIQPGAASYNGGTSARWGDYSGAASDPLMDSMWVAGEYAPPDAGSGDWGTAAAEVTFDTGDPQFTSADQATFTVGVAGSFTVTATGTPAPTLSESGTLPSGVNFTAGNLSAVLSGTPASGSSEVYRILITAANQNGSVTEPFTLTVDEAPAITSAAQAAFRVGSAGNFLVTATGFPAPVVSESGTLPSGVTFFSAGPGTYGLSGTPAAGTEGSYPVQFTASNSAGSVTQAFTLIVTSALYRSVTVLPASAGGGGSGGFAAWAVDSAGTLWYGTQTSAGSAWTWTALHGGFQGTPAVVPVDAGGLTSGGFAVMVVDTSGNLWTGWQTAPGSAWNWAILGSGFQGSPALVAADAGGLTSGGFAVLAVDSSGRMWTGWQTSAGSGWRWAVLATGFQGTPAIVPADGGGLTSGGFAVMAVDTSGNLWTGWQTYAGSGWRWAILATGFQGTPALVPVDAGGLTSGGFAVLAVDTTGTLWTGWQTYAGSGWRWATLATGFQGAGQVAITPVDAGGGTTGGFELWAIDSGGNLRAGLQSAPGSSWTWTTLDTGLQGIPAVEPVTAGGGTTGGFDLWAAGTNGTLQNGQQTAPGSAWTWTSLGLPGS